MNRKEFWNQISRVNKAGLQSGHQEIAAQSLVDVLAEQSVVEIASFYDHLATLLSQLDTSKHASYCRDSSDDSFLYARCFVVAMGQDFYSKVLSAPKNMPSAIQSFELLLYVPRRAWAVATGNNPDFWDYKPKVDFETGSNPDGWSRITTLTSICFRDTPELNRALHSADSSIKFSAALRADPIGDAFVIQLHRLGFTTPSYAYIVLSLSSQLPHGEVLHLQEESNAVRFLAGVDANLYVQGTESERQGFIVQLIVSALRWITNRDKLDVSKVNEAKKSVISWLSRQN